MGVRGAALALVSAAWLVPGSLSAQEAPQPRPLDPGSWVTPDDYPQAAVSAGEQGVIGFTLDVNAAGAVTGCTITQTSLSKLLDETACTLLRERARFEPARDAGGRAVASTFKSRFRWAMPDFSEATRGESFQPLMSVRMVIDLRLAADGSVLRCEGTIARSAYTAYFPPQDYCASFRNRDYRGITRGAPAHMIFTDETLVAGRDLEPAPARPGFETVARDVVRFKVNAEGKAVDCETLENIGSASAPEPCNSPTMPPWSKPETPPVTVKVSRWVIVNRDPAAQ